MEELSQLYEDKATLVRQLEKTPSLSAKAKHVMYNYLLSACLLAALILDIMFVFKFETVNLGPGEKVLLFNAVLSIVLDSIFFIGVLFYFIEIYSWIAARALVTLITLSISFGYYHISIHLLVYLSLLMIIISFALGLLLGVKLFPPRVPKIIEVDIDEVEKLKKTIYVFPD